MDRQDFESDELTQRFRLQFEEMIVRAEKDGLWLQCGTELKTPKQVRQLMDSKGFAHLKPPYMWDFKNPTNELQKMRRERERLDKEIQTFEEMLKQDMEV